MKRAPLTLALILFIIAAVTFCAGTAKAAPYSASACKWIGVDHAVAVLPGGDHYAVPDTMVAAVTSIDAGAFDSVWADPVQTVEGVAWGRAVVTVTLFRSDGAFAGMMWVRDTGDGLIAVMRDDRPIDGKWKPCAAGEVSTAIIESWLVQIAQGARQNVIV